MKKILLLIPQNVIPAVDGGKIGIYMPMKMLAKDYDVKSIVFCNTDEITNAELYKSIGTDVTFIPINKQDTVKNLISNFCTNLPFKFKKYYKKKIKSKIENLIIQWKPDIVLCHHSHLAEYCRDIKKISPTTLLILREHNVEYLLVKQYFNMQKKPIHKLIAYWQYVKTKKFETKCWDYFNTIAFISDSDFQQFNSNRHKTIGTILYDGTLNYRQKPLKNFQSKAFLFTGSIKSFQNAFNLQNFVKNVWIPWKKNNIESKEYELWITGDKNKEMVMNALKLTNEDSINFKIKILGFVDDITEIMHKCSYFLSPTLVGAGIRIKVLEALGIGCVIFLTKKDTEMAEVLKDGINVIEYSDYNSFSLKFQQISKNLELYNKISANAAESAQQHFTWDIFYKKLKTIFEDRL